MSVDNPDTPKTSKDENVRITIQSKSIEYSGFVTVRKAHKMLQLIMENEKQDKASGEASNE